MGVKIYYTTVTASREVKSQQAEVMRILESKNIQFELIDISVGGEVRNEMRTLSGNPSAAPPQIFNDDQYCGEYMEDTKRFRTQDVGLRQMPDYEMFSEAVEADTVEKFLKIA
ncbi:hypothetical protein QTP70_017657 [Hemibagrus guttatus]|uniref:SH3 domain-binding glutamic acid-rich-like protein 3 n=1 Tax=Hemibagrus guttatus TaxID=175788 RepID=A0AAE0PU33_9TELE|nr:hypothetical protein QTP70_017657 [Hemibagrus guttatus]